MTFRCPDWPPDWPEIHSAVAETLATGDWGRYHSQTCNKLEKQLTDSFDAAAVRLCCSGASGLEIALRSARIGTGDEVIVAAYDYPASFRTLELLGARPVLVDNDPDHLSINPDQLSAVASDSVKAVIATHLYGQPARIAEIRQVCDELGWLLFEDACQVIGMRISGRLAGTFGDVGTLSFGGSKQISAGGGGAVLVNSPTFAARLGPIMDRPGEVFPLSPLQAAVIGPQLDKLAQLNRRRQQTVDWLANKYRTSLGNDETFAGWKLLHMPQANTESSHYKLAWLAKDAAHRNRIVDVASQLGLPIGSGYRSASKCSTRRCRKPVPTPIADAFGEKLFVLDHRALLIESEMREALWDQLVTLHDQTAG